MNSKVLLLTLPALAAFAALSSGTVRAEVRLPAIISDHMVLEKSAKVPLWGWADPGEKVLVSLGRQTVGARAGDDGKWTVWLNLEDSTPGPFEVRIQGNNTISVADVVVGEVWVAGGQSNMEWTLGGTLGAADEIAGSANSRLRQFKVQKAAAGAPAEDCKGSWVCAAPETSAAFTAIGYYFGKMLQQELQVPVGLINDNWGGTHSEAWTSREAIDSVPALGATRARLQKILDEYPAGKQAFVEGLGAWIKEHQREDRPVPDAAAFAGMEVSTADWIPVKLPGPLAAPGLPEAGAVWVRRDVDIPAKGMAHITLFLPIDGYDSVYWNGNLLKQTTYQNFPGRGYMRCYGPYTIPAAAINQGRNVLAIRLYQPVGPARFTGLCRADSAVLDGGWRAKAEYEFPALDAETTAAAPPPPVNPPDAQHVACSLFNGMIHPILPYAIAGAIWYQGESNTGRACQYRDSFPLLIGDWRNHWGQGPFPFYYCQLANFMDKKAEPGDSAWAELREAQSMALKVPHTGMAVLIDIGESADIHPRNKKDAGERLARIALANPYGKKIPFSGPRYESMKIEGDKIRLAFSHAGGGLVAKPLPATFVVRSEINATAPLVHNSPGSELEGFAIRGGDRKWVWADAKIDGDTVLVWSDRVPAPVAARYAWADNPTCNLYNAAGLPASPFRTDDDPAVTRNGTY